jgi:hypothetical protein
VVCRFTVSKLLKLPCKTHDLIGVALFDLCAMVVPSPVPRPLRIACSLAAHGQENRALVDHHIRVAISPRIAAAARCTTRSPTRAMRQAAEAVLTEFLLFCLQSAVIFLNIFFDLICDPKKF